MIEQINAKLVVREPAKKTMKVNFLSGGGGGGAVNSVNGKTGNVVLDASDVGALPDTTAIPSKTSDLTNDSGFVNASGAASAAPVQSVNGKTGAVTITEGLSPLIGTTSTVTPAQVMTAIGEGRDVYISAPFTGFIVPLELKFAAWNRATDTVYSGAAVDVVVSQTIIKNDNAFYLFELWGGVFNGRSQAWEVNDTRLAEYDDIAAQVPVKSVNSKTGAVVLNAADVGAVASNQGTANAGKFLVVGSGGIVTPVTMQTWQGGSY